jgi:hypothetical protein
LFLIDLNMEIQQKIIDIIGLENDLKTSDQFTPYTENDFRKSTFKNSENATKYEQVFSSNNEFVPDLSILDLLFNLGPETDQFLKNTDISIKL